jgi:DNA/RNA endonuclease G (NUC1)
MLNTFMMSNMAPQHCAFNRGTWQILESLVRDWSKRTGGLYVISGSVFARDGNGRPDPVDAAVRMKSSNGKARVAVPSHFFKIVAEQTAPGVIVAISFLLPHIPEKIAAGAPAQRQYLAQHLASILTIEALTGLRFFPELPQDQAIVLKQAKASALWPVQGKWPGRLDGMCR